MSSNPFIPRAGRASWSVETGRPNRSASRATGPTARGCAGFFGDAAGFGLCACAGLGAGFAAGRAVVRAPELSACGGCVVAAGAVDRALDTTLLDGKVSTAGAALVGAVRAGDFAGATAFAGAVCVGVDPVVEVGGSGVGTGSGAAAVRVFACATEPSSLAMEDDWASAFDDENPAGGTSGAGCGAPLAATAGAADASTTMQQPASASSRHHRRDEAPVDMTPSRSPAP
jgi:hypothetical protein